MPGRNGKSNHEKLSEKEIKEMKEKVKSYKEAYKDLRNAGGDRLIDSDTEEAIDRLLENEKSYGGEEFQKALGGDFSQFEKVSKAMKSYIAKKEFYKMKQTLEECQKKYGEGLDTADVEKPEVKKMLEENAMNPAFRLMISILRKQYAPAKEAEGADAKSYQMAAAYDSYMGKYLMQKTLAPISKEARQNVIGEFGAEGTYKIERNKRKQCMIAKTLFMAHLGKFSQKEENGSVKEMKENVSEAFVHGGRTAYILPRGEKQRQKELLDAFAGGKDRGESFGLRGRFAATHSVVRKKWDKQGNVKEEFKELKSSNIKIATYRQQYGMNVAVGGLGEMGPSKQLIMDDGTNGHMYMKMREGDEYKSGALLVGFESEESMTTGKLGHKHFITATASHQSSFLSVKGGVGKKIGGRTVDLTGLSAAGLKTAIETFEDGYAKLQELAEKKGEFRERLQEINADLAGKPMTLENLGKLMVKVGFDRETATQLINGARNGKLRAEQLPSEDNLWKENVKEQKVPQKPNWWNRLCGNVFRREKHQKIIREYDQYIKRANQKLVERQKKKEEAEKTAAKLDRDQKKRDERIRSLEPGLEKFEKGLERFPKDSGMYSIGMEAVNSMNELIASTGAEKIPAGSPQQARMRKHIAKLICYQKLESSSRFVSKDPEKAKELNDYLKETPKLLEKKAEALCQNKEFLDMLPEISPDGIYRLLSDANGIRHLCSQCDQKKLWGKMEVKETLQKTENLQKDISKAQPEIENPQKEPLEKKPLEKDLLL